MTTPPQPGAAEGRADPTSESADAAPGGAPAGGGEAGAHVHDTPPTGGARGGWLGALFVAIVSFALYYPSTDYELVYDDWFLINPQTNTSMRPVLHDLGAVWGLFGQEYWEGVSVGGLEVFGARGQALYRPLTLAVWGVINHFQFKDDPSRALVPPTSREALASAAPFHWVNVIANAITCAVFFLMLRRLFGNQLLALLAALLYAVHPLHTEAVSYVAGLSDILTGLTVFLGLICWHALVSTPGRARVGPLIGLVVTFFLGLLAKESAVLLLPAVILADLMFSLRGKGPSVAQRVASYAALAVVVAANIAIRFSIMGRLTPDYRSLSHIDNPLVADYVTDWMRILNSFKLVARYLWLTLWPQDLSIDYSFNQIPVSESFTEPAPLAGLVLVLALLVVGLVRLRSWPAFGFGLLLFLGTCAFFSNLLTAIGTIFAERLAYLPTAGLALAGAALLVRLFGTERRGVAALHPVGLLLALVAVGALGMRTVERNEDFRSAVVLFESARETTPNSSRVYYQLGSIYETQQLYDRALQEMNRALRIDPYFFQARMRAADILAKAGRYEEAIKAYRAIIDSLSMTNEDGSSNREIHALLWQSMAGALQATGDLAAAEDAIERARELGGVAVSAPDETIIRHVALLQGQERWAESLAVIEDGLIEHPDSVRLQLAKAKAASQLGDLPTYEQALAGLDETAEGGLLADMMRAEVQYNRAAVDADDAALEEAMVTFERIAEKRPDFATPYTFRGRYLLDIADDAEAALIEFDKALELSPLDPEALRNKALAEMRLGRWEQALGTLQRLGTVNPDVAYHVLLADVHFNLGNLAEAEAQYEAMEELLPEGSSPVEPVISRAMAVAQQGRLEEALEIYDQALLVPRNQDNVRLLVFRGELLLTMKRFDEALASFDRAEASFAQQPDLVYDEYLPLKRALCLMVLERDVEAAAALEKVEQRLPTLEWPPRAVDLLRVKLLERRAQLHLRPDGVFQDLARVEQLCQQGMQITGGRHPPFYDLSIDALVQQGDYAAAADRARQGAQVFTGTPHEGIYALAQQALQAAADGRVDEAEELLAGSVQPLHQRLRDLLQPA